MKSPQRNESPYEEEFPGNHEFATNPPYRMIQGNAEAAHAEVGLVDCVITSPPYFNQRKYGDSAEEIGRENDVESYVQSLADVLGSIQMAPYGSLYVNIGDKRENGFLLGIPHLLADALVNVGFRLIEEIVWAKGVVFNQHSWGDWMPEPSKNRLNGNGHESLFRFARGDARNLYCDAVGVAVPKIGVPNVRYLPAELMSVHTVVGGRSRTNVWAIPPGRTREGHYAVFPSELIEIPIAMTCPIQVCRKCGKPRERLVTPQIIDDGRGRRCVGKRRRGNREISGRNDTGAMYTPRRNVTTGWSSCECADYRRGIVYDPFAGTASTGVAAIKMGRTFVGTELYQNNVDIARKRLQEAEEELAKTGIDPIAYILRAGLEQPDLGAAG